MKTATRTKDDLPSPGLEYTAPRSAAAGPSQYVDAATRISSHRNPSFERWYYGIEDELGQGTVGMGVWLAAFILLMFFAFFIRPI